VPLRGLISELLDFVSEAADIFKSQDELDRVRKILVEGTSADKQLQIYEKTQSYQAVVDHLISETMRGA